MNFIQPEQFDAAMASPSECSSLLKALASDMAVLIAIISGPEATEDKHKLLIKRIAQDLKEGAAVAYSRLRDQGQVSVMVPGGMQ